MFNRHGYAWSEEAQDCSLRYSRLRDVQNEPVRQKSVALQALLLQLR